MRLALTLALAATPAFAQDHGGHTSAPTAKAADAAADARVTPDERAAAREMTAMRAWARTNGVGEK